MQKILLRLTFLLLITSCNQTHETSFTKTEKDSISQIELMKIKNRRKLIETYIPSTFSANYTVKDSVELEVSGEYICQFDRPIIIPEKYLSVKLGEDLSTYNFIEKIVVKNNKDTSIFRFLITKDLFMSKLNKDMKKYGTLAETKFEGYNSLDNSFDFIASIGIPTGASQAFNLKIFRTGKFSITDYE